MAAAVPTTSQGAQVLTANSATIAGVRHLRR